MTNYPNLNSRQRGSTAAGLGGLALMSVLLFCGAGNAPIANFSPQGAMQADLNAGGHNVTNVATLNATNVAASSVSTTNLTVGGQALGSAAFAGTNAFLAPAAIGTTVQAYNASTTTLGNTVNGTNSLVQTDGNGALVDPVLKLGTKIIRVSKSLGSDTRTGLSKYSVVTPFATLAAAASAAASGDTILAQDGAFTDKNLVLVSGVNWIFLPAATITVTGAANGDVLFKDSGTTAAVTISGCGQTFSLSSTTTSASITGLAITAPSTVTISGIGLTVGDSASGGTATALSCAGGSSKVTITGDLFATGGSSGFGYGVYFGSTNGGAVTINGNVTGNATVNGYGFYATGTTAGQLTVTQRIVGTNEAVNNSTATVVTCGQLVDTNGASVTNNRLTLNCPVPVVQAQSGTTTGFTDAFLYGPQDTIMQISAAGTLASGTVTLPADANTRVGERLTIMSNQTITALTVSVASGTIYGWSSATLSPGSITFQKVATNVWTKL